MSIRGNSKSLLMGEMGIFKELNGAHLGRMRQSDAGEESQQQSRDYHRVPV
jgi:hypothetical protein